MSEQEREEKKVPVLVLTEEERFTLQWLVKMFVTVWGGFSDPQYSYEVRCLRRKLKALEEEQDLAKDLEKKRQLDEVKSLEKMLGKGEQEGRA